MILPLILIGGAIAFATMRRNSAHRTSLELTTGAEGYDRGEGPYDRFPSGTDQARVVSINQVKASSGNPYTVREFKRDGGQVYYLAVRSDDSRDWVGYLFDPTSKTRVLYSANAETAEGITQLRKDFGL